jgi:alkyl hydroperoxide reductase subunit F
MDLPGFSLDLAALEETKRPDPQETYDLLILGGGPAALAAAVYAARKMLKVVLITRDFGGQVGDTSVVENYLGFQTITGQELVNRFVEHVKKFEVPVAEGETIAEVRKDDGLFGVLLESGSAYSARTVIAALGKRHRKLVVDCHCRTSVAGLFGAGDITTVPYDQIVISAGEGAKAALSAYDFMVRQGML